MVSPGLWLRQRAEKMVDLVGFIMIYRNIGRKYGEQLGIYMMFEVGIRDVQKFVLFYHCFAIFHANMWKICGMELTTKTCDRLNLCVMAI